MSRAGRRRLSGGFSLVELLVVVALIALAGGLAAATLRAGRQGQASEAMIAGVVSGLRNARTRAVAGDGAVRFVLDLKRRQYGWAPEKPLMDLPKDTDIVFLTAASEVIRADAAAIGFHPDGTSTGGEIRLSRRGRAWTVRVNWLTGAVTATEAPSPSREAGR